MPDSTPNREAVKTLAKAIGIREAARRMGLSEWRVLKWSQRDPDGPWDKQPDAKALSTPSITGSILQQASPQSVLKPSQAMANVLQSHSEKTKLGLSKAAYKAAKAFGKKNGEVIIEQAQEFRHIVSASSTLHGWEDKAQLGVSVQILQANGSMNQ